VVKIENSTAPLPLFSPNTLSFPDQTVGTTSASQLVTLTNKGDAPLTIVGIQTTGDFGQTNTCGAGLDIEASCTIRVSFVPTAAGVRSGSLNISDNAPNSPQSIQLSGNAVTPPPDFAISALPTSATVPAGQAATITLMITPISGFNQQVTLSCSGAPQNANCSMSTNQLTLGGTTPSTATLTVATGLRTIVAPIIRVSPRFVFRILHFGPSLTLLIALLFLFLVGSSLGRWQRRPALAGFGLTVILFLVMVGCGSGAAGVPVGTPAGIYQVMVTGTSGSITHTTAVTLQVK